MTIKTNILDEVKRFYDDEYKNAELFIKRHSKDTNTIYFTIETSISMCLGVAQFAQYIGASYEEITEIYDKQKARLENLKRGRS